MANDSDSTIAILANTIFQQYNLIQSQSKIPDYQLVYDLLMTAKEQAANEIQA
jgi:hypothetical protein